MQKTARNRYPPPASVSPATTPQRALVDRRNPEETWRRNLPVKWNEFSLIQMFRLSDSLESCKSVFEMGKQIEETCANGNLEALQAAFEEIRNSSDTIMNRSTSWQFWDNVPCHFLKAYQNNHWHVIAYLAQQPELHITPFNPALGSGEPDFPSKVADDALKKNHTGDLDRLLNVGWDINAHSFFGVSTLCRVVSSDNLVKWHLAHGASPNTQGGDRSTPMVYAAREASIASLKLLVEHGGQVKGSDLVAQAAIGHSWGRQGRLDVIKYLLDNGADINTMAASTWIAPEEQFRGFDMNDFMATNAGGQTALHVAHISQDITLAKFLLENGADPSIQPAHRNSIEEFVYLGEMPV